MDMSLYVLDEKRANISALASLEDGGLFTEAANDYLEATKMYEVKCAKVEAYTEATERELEINLAKSELKCFEENGTMDDLVYLEEAANDGALAKLKNLIDAAIAAFKEWISEIKTKVLRNIASAEARKTLKAAEKKIKLNPFLSKKKVEITNTKKPLSVINQYKSKVDKISAKLVVKGIVSEQQVKTLRDTKEEFRSDFKNAIIGKSAVVTITVSALVAKLSSDIDKLPSYIDTVEKQNTTVLNKLKGTLSPESAAACSAATNAAANFRSELAREEVNTVIDGVMEEMRVLKSAVMKAKGNTEVKPVKESADDFDPFFNESDYGVDGLFDESADDELGLGDLFADFETEGGD